jgi:hypothetical protein
MLQAHLERAGAIDLRYGLKKIRGKKWINQAISGLSV